MIWCTSSRHLFLCPVVCIIDVAARQLPSLLCWQQWCGCVYMPKSLSHFGVAASRPSLAWQLCFKACPFTSYCLLCAATAAFRSDTLEEDDDDGQSQHPAKGSSTTPAVTAASAAAAAEAEAALAAAAARLPVTPRLRTRLFAAELLLSLFSAVGPDPKHKHPRPKYGDPTGSGGAAAVAAGLVAADFLVNHLQTLVDLGFKLTTGSADSLRPSGAQLLQQLLRFFGTVPDPDVPELLLLEQYQVCVPRVCWRHNTRV